MPQIAPIAQAAALHHIAVWPAARLGALERGPGGQRTQALRLQDMAADLTASAKLWRDGRLE